MNQNKVDKSLENIPLQYFKDFYDWPRHWMGFKEDLDLGNSILLTFRASKLLNLSISPGWF